MNTLRLGVRGYAAKPGLTGTRFAKALMDSSLRV